MKNKKLKVLNCVLFYSILFVSLYVAVCTVGWFMTGNEPPTQLSMLVGTFFGSELCMTTFIKVFKIKKGE